MRFSFPSLSLKSSKSSKDVADVDKRGGGGEGGREKFFKRKGHRKARAAGRQSSAKSLKD